MPATTHIFDDTFPVLPLSYERLHPNGRIQSAFPLFILPTDLFHETTPFLSPQDLAALAQVDHDCNLLARSIQFSDVKLDHTMSSLGLLDALFGEAQRGLGSLGPCIRRLRISFGFQTLHRHSYLDLFPSYPFIHAHINAGNKDTDFSTAFLQIVVLVIQSLPNIHTLDWDGWSGPLSGDMLKCLAQSPVRHLRIGSAQVASCPEGEELEWKLETLSVGISWPGPGNMARALFPFVHNLLRGAAATLHTLIWRCDSEAEEDVGVLLAPHLPNLRVLCLEGEGLTVPLRCLARVHHLSLDKPPQTYLPALEQFHSHFQDDDLNDLLPFLQQNTHLTSFAMSQSTFLDAVVIDAQVLPVLGGMFNLTSLNLSWNDTIPLSSLAIVASNLPAIRNLWLSAGPGYWTPDHSGIWRIISPLQRLERLAFTRDSYAVSSMAHPLQDPTTHGVQGFYTYKHFPQGVDYSAYITADEKASLSCTDFDQALIRQRHVMSDAWDRWHAEVMTKVAREYGTKLGQLRWCYVGQVCVSMERTMESRMMSLGDGITHLRKIWDVVTFH